MRDETENVDWLSQIRTLFEESKAFDWQRHLGNLNALLGLNGADELRLSFAGLPPFWFNGDIESVRPGTWTLVVSLNHQLASGKEDVSRDGFWDFCRTHNSRYFYAKFFRPLLTVAANALGHDVDDEREYATRQMVFVELCPYASQRFNLDPATVASLVESDRGFRIEAAMADILLQGAAPALVMLNGVATIRSYEAAFGDSLEQWRTVSYPSVEPHGRSRWHTQGQFRAGDRSTPIIGFPFLRTMSSANSTAEIRQLGIEARRQILSV